MHRIIPIWGGGPYPTTHKDRLEMRFIGRFQRLLLILGLLLIAIYGAVRLYREVLSRAELKRFQDLQAERSVEVADRFPPDARFKLDFSHWSEKRIAGYEHSLVQHIDPPLAVLRISKVHLEVPVLEGTDELVLNRGVGHIAGTVRPGEVGNIGIAGHRDGFFRVLKDVRSGDTIELVTPDRTVTFVVEQIVLVDPDDVSVLQPRSISSLTLVTCYPFYYVGSAPQRYIVEASITNSDLPKQASSERRDAELEQSTR
jgi:sortase A